MTSGAEANEVEQCVYDTERLCDCWVRLSNGKICPLGTDLVTVCEKCKRASCWQGEFMCDDGKSASTVERTRDELTAYDLEACDWWSICPTHGVAFRACKCPGMKY